MNESFQDAPLKALLQDHAESLPDIDLEDAIMDALPEAKVPVRILDRYLVRAIACMVFSLLFSGSLVVQYKQFGQFVQFDGREGWLYLLLPSAFLILLLMQMDPLIKLILGRKKQKLSTTKS